MTSTGDRQNVAILGGGMAGLAAAWRLSEPEYREQVGSITVYQRGWRLGGKGASSRGANGRIEEHGLHVWLGYYDNAFRLIRSCYEELDRERTAPGCPLQTWTDAFRRASVVGVEDRHHGEWHHWISQFSENDLVPGDESPPGRPLTPTRFVERAVGLLVDLAGSLDHRTHANPPGRAVLSASPHPPRRRADPMRQFLDFGGMVRQAELAGLVGVLEISRLLAELPADRLRSDPLAGPLLDHLSSLEDDLASRIGRADDARRIGQVVNMVVAAIRGVITDGVMSSPSGFRGIDHLDLREWLAKHGAADATLDSALLRGMYDLVFAYEGGDHERPRFPAGLGLLLAGKMFFDYKGALFWKMQAGMGEVVFAPLYEALRTRGVRFEFFHRVDDLHLDHEGTTVEAVSLGLQARLRPELEQYDPLADYDGLPCFPDRPDVDQLAQRLPVPHDGESHWEPRDDVGAVRLERGRDFDHVVIAMSLGMLPHVASELIDHSPRWKAMVDEVATVATQSLQLWLGADEADLGWPHPGATVSGYESPFDTYASMGHLLPLERWVDPRPRSLAYFCSVLPDADAPPHSSPEVTDRLVRDNAVELLRTRIAHFWPRAVSSEGFRWELLAGTDEATGEARLDHQYLVAAADPSDRYVQSLPGTARFRLAADDSGYDKVHLAGDWTACGLEAGCIEAASMSGLQAANSVLGRPLMEGIAGGWSTLPSARAGHGGNGG